jgi:hypothetical protein
MDRTWTDEELYKRYGIDADQVEFIKSLIAERPGSAPESIEEEDE